MWVVSKEADSGAVQLLLYELDADGAGASEFFD